MRLAPRADSFLPVFVVGKESVRDPDLFREISGQRQDLVLLRAEGQPLVLPVLVQVHRYGVVLEKHDPVFVQLKCYLRSSISGFGWDGPHLFTFNDL